MHVSHVFLLVPEMRKKLNELSAFTVHLKRGQGQAK